MEVLYGEVKSTHDVIVKADEAGAQRSRYIAIKLPLRGIKLVVVLNHFHGELYQTKITKAKNEATKAYTPLIDTASPVLSPPSAVSGVSSSGFSSSKRSEIQSTEHPVT